MRKVDRTLIIKPATLGSADCTNHLNQILVNPAIKPVGDYYRGKVVHADGTFTNTVTVALKNLYKKKCAYCEKMCHNPEVEHFRPANQVTGNQNLANGYYWLGYEWTNLLPSCHDCNKLAAKGTKFPILAIRKGTHPVVGNPPAFDNTQNAFDSAYLTAERPLYIHPEYCDDFWAHFKFDREGLIIGISDEGKKTVADLKLDDEDRNGFRREIYDLHHQDLLTLILKYKRQDNPISEAMFEEDLSHWLFKIVYESLDDEKQYTLFRKYLVKEINYFFIDSLDVTFRPEMKQKIAEALNKLQ